MQWRQLFTTLIANFTIPISGKICSIAATKTFRKQNRSMLDDSDDTKRITGRTIDLMIVDGVELTANEWKSEQATDKLIEDQRVKNYQ